MCVIGNHERFRVHLFVFYGWGPSLHIHCSTSLNLHPSSAPATTNKRALEYMHGISGPGMRPAPKSARAAGIG